MNQHANEPTLVPRCRRFTLKDAMVLIAAAAIGMSFAARAYTESRRAFGRHPIPHGHRVSHAIGVFQSTTWPCIASLAVACFALRLVKPRPHLRVLALQPGVVACAVATLCITEAMLVSAAQKPLVNGFIPLTSLFVGMSIATAWVAEWINGWWKPEFGWLDGTGRLLGVLLIVWPFVYCMSLVVHL